MDPSTTFSLTEATLQETPSIVAIHCLAWADNDIWRLCMGTSSSAAEQAWLIRGFAHRNSLPDRKVFKITERATGKIVAFTTLTFPYTLSPSQLAFAKEEESPPAGCNPAICAEFFERLEAAGRYGYDPLKDFHKKGTMVHPAYQRLGLGTWLTKHCNEIADNVGGRTFVLARPTSKGMFEKMGFKVLGCEDLDLVRYGGQESEGRGWVLVREPGGGWVGVLIVADAVKKLAVK